MEARNFTRCLRARPTQLAWHRPTPITSQPRLNKSFIRYNSSNNSPSNTPTDTATQPAQRKPGFKSSQTPTENRPSAGMRGKEFNDVMRQLNLGGSGSGSGPTPVDSAVERETTPTARPRHRSFIEHNSYDYSNRPLPPQSKTAGPEMKLGPNLGRAVTVAPERRMDLSQALRVLAMNNGGNKLRATRNAQKFYVRGGQKRKDLKSQRWRKLFKFSFQRTCQRVNRLASQGW